MSEFDGGGEVIAALRLAGADKFDPVRLHYLQVLAHRAKAHQGPVRRILDARLAQALSVFGERFAQAQSAARDASDRNIPHKQIKPPETLGDLTRHLGQRLAAKAGAGIEGDTGLRPELETTRYFRNTWAKLSIDKRVAQALHHAPKNAGPINSHLLVLRSLELMRDISPDYLNRFTSYVDTLLCLDQCLEDKQALAKKPLKARLAKR